MLSKLRLLLGSVALLVVALAKHYGRGKFSFIVIKNNLSRQKQSFRLTNILFFLPFVVLYLLYQNKSGHCAELETVSCDSKFRQIHLILKTNYLSLESRTECD